MNQHKQHKKPSFLDINWSLNSNDDLLLFPSSPNKQSPQVEPLTNDKITTLSQIRKLYNELYSHFINIQGLVIEGGDQFIADERVREIVSISNRYQSVILSTRDQIQRALETGNYLDYDDADSFHNPYDNQLKQEERSRISQIMEDAYKKNYSLIIFCGNVDSIYPTLCNDLSNQIGINCKLISRDSKVFNHHHHNDNDLIKSFNNDKSKMSNKLIILNRKEYSKRIEYIDKNINDLESPIFIDCDLIYLKYKQEIENLNIISMILKITHLFYFSPTISPHQLLDCLQQQQQQLDQGLMTQFEELTQDIGSVEQDQVLSFVCQLLCHGLIDESIHLLNLLSRIPKSSSTIQLKSMTSSSATNTTNLRRSPIGVMIDLLQRIPIRRKTHFSNEYIQLWQQWHQEVDQILSSGIMNSGGLGEMISLLNGDEKVLAKYNNSNGQTAYLQSVVTHLLYVEHVSSPQQIRQLFVRYYSRFNSTSRVDRIIKCLAAPDQLEVALKKMAKNLPSWLVVHVTDLLSHHPYVLKRHPHQPSPLLSTRDKLLTDYGLQLSQDPSLLDIAFGYINQTKQSTSLIDTIIQQQTTPNTISERKAYKLLSYSSQKSINHIFKVLAIRDFDLSRFASSINWLLMSKDITRIAQLSNYLLRHQLNTILLNDLDSINQKENLPQELDFLIKYKYLIHFYKVKEFENYCNYFCEMFRNQIVPRSFSIRLMLDIIPLMESSNKVYVDYDNTMMLINYLQDIQSSHLSDEYLQGISKQNLQSLQLALSRNISKSFKLNQQQLFQQNNQQLKLNLISH